MILHCSHLIRIDKCFSSIPPFPSFRVTFDTLTETFFDFLHNVPKKVHRILPNRCTTRKPSSPPDNSRSCSGRCRDSESSCRRSSISSRDTNSPDKQKIAKTRRATSSHSSHTMCTPDHDDTQVRVANRESRV